MADLLDGLKIKTKTTTTTQHSLELSGAAIKRHLGIPNDARVKVSIPGGGDWSNTDLDLDNGTTLDIDWETVK